ncbi:hypothetical protein MUK42_13994 [Musa troglodytarum]|uniref:Uncharacterized protein n=1 Tax=Musa troglodytarum TaxID=320322 RepID=A0A9E7LG02_9LILI|nr:hypothetical protein MUK42_13994 [Musa troglodytarum]
MIADSKSARVARAASASLESNARACARTAAVESKEKIGSISGRSSATASYKSKSRNSFSGDRFDLATNPGKPRNWSAASPAMSAKTTSRTASEPAKTWSRRTRSPWNRVLTATLEAPSQDRTFSSSTAQSSFWIWARGRRSKPSR